MTHAPILGDGYNHICSFFVIHWRSKFRLTEQESDRQGHALFVRRKC